MPLHERCPYPFSGAWVASIEDRILAREADLIQTGQNLKDLLAMVGQPFEHAARLEELITRQGELVQSLDLTKNQASSELDSDEIEVEMPSPPIWRKVSPLWGAALLLQDGPDRFPLPEKSTGVEIRPGHHPFRGC